MCSLFTRFQLKKRLRLKKGRMWSAGLYGKCVSSGLACRTTVRCRAPAAARSYRHPPAASTAAPVITISVWPQLSTTFFHRLATACPLRRRHSRRLVARRSRGFPPLNAARRRSTPLNACAPAPIFTRHAPPCTAPPHCRLCAVCTTHVPRRPPPQRNMAAATDGRHQHGGHRTSSGRPQLGHGTSSGRHHD